MFGFLKRNKKLGPVDDFWYNDPPFHSLAGVNVNWQSAMGVPAVNRAVRLISDSLSTLPVKLYVKQGDDRRPAKEHPLFDLVGKRPNGYQSSQEFRSLLQGHLLLHGNAYAEIIRDHLKKPVGLVPLRPDLLAVEVEGGRLKYSYPKTEGGQRVIRPENMLHLRDQSFSDGILGASRIEQAREAIGLALAVQKYSSAYFRNNARPGGILSTEQILNEDTRKALAEHWRKIYSGADNANKVAILGGGLQWTNISNSNQESQLIELKTFAVREIARIFGVPSYMIGDDSEASTYANVESRMIEFVTHSLRPWLVVWEQALNHALLGRYERRDHYFEFKLDSLA